MNKPVKNKNKTDTKTLYITALPYATQNGTIQVPADLTEEDYHDYVQEHFDDIEFNEIDLDYCGTDIEINE